MIHPYRHGCGAVGVSIHHRIERHGDSDWAGRPGWKHLGIMNGRNREPREAERSGIVTDSKTVPIVSAFLGPSVQCDIAGLLALLEEKIFFEDAAVRSVAPSL